ncbi:MAG: glycosyltransferase family 39 protein [Candidatus Omnitrophota bacterium]
MVPIKTKLSVFKGQPFILVILFTLIIIINFILLQANPHIEIDGVFYAKAGEQLIKGEGYPISCIYPPFYPFMIGMFSLLFGGLEISGRLVSILYSSLLVGPLFLIARWAFGRKIALASCSLAVIYPGLCEFSTKVLAESTFVFFFLMGLIITWEALSHDKAFFYFISGLIWGIVYLTKSQGIVYILFLVLIILVIFFKKRKIIFIKYICFTIVGFLIISSPYLLYLEKKGGNSRLGSRAVLSLVFGENVGKENLGSAFEKYLFSLPDKGTRLNMEIVLENNKGVLHYILSNPKELIRRYILNIHLINKYVIPELFSPFILIVFSAGLFLGDIRETRKALVLFLAFIPYILSLPLFEVAPRYFHSFIPIVLIWAARGIVEISQWFGKAVKASQKKQNLIEIGLLILIVLSFIPFTFRPFFRDIKKKGIYQEIGGWLKDNTSEGSILVSRKPWIPFYAERNQIALPFEPLDKVLRFARYNKADYLIVDESVIKGRLDLMLLLDQDYSSEDLKIINRFKDKAGQKIYIYQILKKDDKEI